MGIVKYREKVHRTTVQCESDYILQNIPSCQVDVKHI